MPMVPVIESENVPVFTRQEGDRNEDTPVKLASFISPALESIPGEYPHSGFL
jgi:hypothetical protein